MIVTGRDGVGLLAKFDARDVAQVHDGAVRVRADHDGAELLGLDKTALIHDPMWVALPVDHKLARKHNLALIDLRDQDWVQTSPRSACARHVISVCRSAGFEPRVSFESDDYDTVQGLVAAGVGVALIPRLALSHRRPGLVVRRLAPENPVRSVFAATPRAPAVLPAAQEMLRILSQRAHEFVALGED